MRSLHSVCRSAQPGRGAVRLLALGLGAVLTLGACTGGDTPDDGGTNGAAPPRTTVQAVESFAGKMLSVVVEDVDESWVTETLVVVDPERFEVVGRIPLGDPIPSEETAINARIVAADGVVWVTRAGDTSTKVFRVPAGVADVDFTAEIPVSDANLAVGAGAAWVTAGSKVVALDLTTGAVASEVVLEPVGAGFVAIDVAVVGADVFISSDTGGLAHYVPSTGALSSMPALVAMCSENPASREQFAANARDTILDLAVSGTTLIATTSSGCNPDPGVALLDPTGAVPTRTISLPAGPFQLLTAVPSGTGVVVARSDANDVVPIDLTVGRAEATIVLPPDTLAETCSGGPTRVACVSGLDDVAVGTWRDGTVSFEKHNVLGLRGTVLAWGVAG